MAYYKYKKCFYCDKRVKSVNINKRCVKCEEQYKGIVIPPKTTE